MTDNSTDDVALLAALAAALHNIEDPPPDVIAAARACYAWHAIDAELAELTFDSTRQQDLATMRARSAAVQALTFTSPQLTIELEIAGRTVRGQLVPHQSGDVEFQLAGGDVVRVRTNELGYFTADFVPRGRFRLCCRTSQQAVVTTVWVSLDAEE